MENWQFILYDSMRAGSPWMSALYLISWIFIGNFMLLNLFLAILLDSFTPSSDETTPKPKKKDEEDEEDAELKA